MSLRNDKQGEDFTLDEMWFFKKAVVLVAVGKGI